MTRRSSSRRRRSARAARKARQRPATEDVHEIRDVDAGGVAATALPAERSADLGLLVFLHGGGWVIGDLDSHDNVCRALANGSGHAVLSVDYRLAPEFPFPAALEDALTATRWAHANAESLGCRADRIAIGGDSAGGNLAAVVAQLGAGAARVPVARLPGHRLHAFAPEPRRERRGLLPLEHRDAVVHRPLHRGDGDGPARTRGCRLCSRATTVLAATPPALVITAEFDPLRDEGDAYAAKLAAAGVPTSHVRFGGMFHGFFSLADFLDDGKSGQRARGGCRQGRARPEGPLTRLGTLRPPWRRTFPSDAGDGVA